MIIGWQCPKCDGQIYPENEWTVGGTVGWPPLWRKVIAWFNGQDVEPSPQLWHGCPRQHFYPGGAPYGGAPTRVILADGSHLTLATMAA